METLHNLPNHALFTLPQQPALLLRRLDSSNSGIEIQCKVVAFLDSTGFIAIDNEPYIGYNRYTTVCPLLPMVAELV